MSTEVFSGPGLMQTFPIGFLGSHASDKGELYVVVFKTWAQKMF